MRRRLNEPFLFRLLIAIFVLGTAVHLLHGFQVRRNATALLRQAVREEEQDRLDRAVEYLGRYLTYFPDDTDALLDYCRVLDRRTASGPERWQVLAVLEEGIRRAPAQASLRRRLVEVAIELQQYADARRHLDILLESSPHDSELERLASSCEMAAGEYARAASWLERTLARDPGDWASAGQLADLLRRHLGRAREADQIMDRLVAANPQAGPAYLARARYRKELGRLDAAAADAARACALAPADVAILAMAADIAEARGRWEEARAALERGLRAAPQDPALYRGLARLELRQGRRAEALACVRRGLKLLPEQNELLAVEAELLVKQQDLAQAEPVVAQLRARGWQPTLVGYLEAALDVGHSRWAAAAARLEQLRTQAGASQELTCEVELLLAECQSRLGDTEQQLAACQRAVAADPFAGHARYSLGNALLAGGRVDAAVAAFRQAAVLRDPPAAVWPALANALLLHTRALPEARRDWQQVDETIERAAQRGADPAELAVLRAGRLQATGQSGPARALLDAAIRQDPQSLELRLALAGRAAEEHHWDEACQVLEEARRQLGDRMELRLALAAYWEARGGPEAHAQLTALARDPGHFSVEAQTALFRGLAEAAGRLGDLSLARRWAAQAAASRPNDLGSRLFLFDLAITMGDEAALETLESDLKRLDGEDGALWRYAHAARAVARARRGDRSGLAEARTYLTEAARRRPNWSRVPLLEAQLAELTEDPGRAIACYLRALDLGESGQETILRAAGLLYQRRRYREADQVFRRLAEPSRLQGRMAQWAAESALHSRALERALDLAHQAVPADTRDGQAVVWLGQLLSSAGRAAEAEATLRRAADLNPGNPDPWVALVQHLNQTKQRARVEETIEEAGKRLAPKAAALGKARCYETIGQMRQADSLYQVALSARATEVSTLQAVAGFYLRADRPDEAEPILRRLLEPPVRASHQVIAWARRQLALVLASHPARVEEALALVDANAGKAGLSPADARARAAVLGSRADQRREAIGQIEQSAAATPLAPDEQLTLAQLYEADGNLARAREQLVSLLATQAHSPRYLAYHVHLLLMGNEVRDAERWLSRLEDAAPDDPRTRTLETQVRAAKAKRRQPPARG
jgi:predicted Zn-dependent protease